MPYKDPVKAKEQKSRWQKEHPEYYAALARAKRKGPKGEEVRATERKSKRKLAGVAEPTGDTAFGLCPLCHRERKLVYDHDHLTGKFRGYICRACNSTLGFIQDSPETLQRLCTYLESSGKKTVYLAGGIAGLSGPETEAKFNTNRSKLEQLGLTVLSPIRGKVLDPAGSSMYEPAEIVTRDLNDIKGAHFLITEPSLQSIGSWMELYHARVVEDIPVIVIATDPHIVNHYWVRHFASKIVPDIDAAVDYIRRWYL